MCNGWYVCVQHFFTTAQVWLSVSCCFICVTMFSHHCVSWFVSSMVWCTSSVVLSVAAWKENSVFTHTVSAGSIRKAKKTAAELRYCVLIVNCFNSSITTLEIMSVFLHHLYGLGFSPFFIECFQLLFGLLILLLYSQSK